MANAPENFTDESVINWKKPLILAAILAVLGGGAYWLQNFYQPQKTASETATKKPLDLTGKSVAHILLQNGVKSHFLIKCLDLADHHCKPGDASRWELEEPLRSAADDNNGNSLVNNLNNLVASDLISLKDETADKRAALLKDYGLSAELRASKAAHKFEVGLADGSVRTLYLGEVHPLGDALFAVAGDGPLVNENTVYLVPTFIKTNLEDDLAFWRNKKLFDATTAKIETFEFTGPKGKISGVRKNGEWTLGDLPGDIEAVDTFLSSALFASAKDFTSEDKTSAAAKHTLQGTKLLIHLSMDINGKSSDLDIYQKKSGKGPSTFAMVSGRDPLYGLDPAVVNRLDKSIKDLRLSRLIGSLDRFNSTKITVSGSRYGDHSVILTQKSGAWVAEGLGGDVAKEKVSVLLDKLAATRMRDFIAMKDAQTGHAEAITVTLADDKNIRRKIEIWKAGETGYARDLLNPARSDQPEVGVIDVGLFDAIPSQAEAWKKGYVDPNTPAPAKPAPAPSQKIK